MHRLRLLQHAAIDQALELRPAARRALLPGGDPLFLLNQNIEQIGRKSRRKSEVLPYSRDGSRGNVDARREERPDVRGTRANVPRRLDNGAHELNERAP